ncbi:MAG: ATPase [Bacteroidaceae bacterium]|nr:ATPase [Bacteroidaceae bacterium]
MPLLIADSGSTKTEWLLRDGAETITVRTGGINPALMADADVRAAIAEAVSNVLAARTHGKDSDAQLLCARVYYYGAGCTPERIPVVERALRDVLVGAEEVEVRSDLVGAARALVGRGEGIACILGTGEASCLCRDGEIMEQTPSLGYILGDEGSGAVLGRLLLGAVFKRQLPQAVCDAFHAEYALTQAEAIARIYRSPQPNRFLASFAPFLAKHREVDAVCDLLVTEFRRFFRHNIAAYSRPDLPVSFVGSVAHHFALELRAAARAEGFSVDRILQMPLPALSIYHNSTP